MTGTPEPKEPGFLIDPPKEWTIHAKTPAQIERSRKYFEQLEAWRKANPGQDYPPATVTYVFNG